MYSRTTYPHSPYSSVSQPSPRRENYSNRIPRRQEGYASNVMPSNAIPSPSTIPSNATPIQELVQNTISGLLTPEEKKMLENETQANYKIPTGATSPMTSKDDQNLKRKIQEEEEDTEEDKEDKEEDTEEDKEEDTEGEDKEIEKTEKEAEKEEKKEINEKRNPIVRIFGHELDRDSLIVHMAIIAVWVFIWYGTGLKKVIGKDIIFSIVFVIFIVYNLASIATAGTSSGGVVYELNILLTVEQMVSILFGTVVLFSLFHKNIPVNENCKSIIHRICLSNVIILTISSLWVSVWTSGRAFRSIRKFKQGIYNIALTLFITVGIIFIKGNCPNGQK